MGANIFKDIFASVRDIVGGRSGEDEDELTKARKIGFQELEQETLSIGAIVGVDIDCEVVGKGGSMLMVSISETAIRYVE